MNNDYEPQFMAYFPEMPKMRSHLDWIIELISDCRKTKTPITKLTIPIDQIPVSYSLSFLSPEHKEFLLFGVHAEIGEFDFEIEEC